MKAALSRQALWQQQNKAQGRCTACAGPNDGAQSRCAGCRLKLNIARAQRRRDEVRLDWTSCPIDGD